MGRPGSASPNECSAAAGDCEVSRGLTIFLCFLSAMNEFGWMMAPAGSANSAFCFALGIFLGLVVLTDVGPEDPQ